jgi:SAM-dependent methyltransferase
MSGTWDRARHRRASDAAYFIPRLPSEIDRLDIQHYANRGVVGANYVAPLVRPARILDVGSGTGQWAHELAEEFPDALVVGLDLVRGKPGGPRNHRTVRVTRPGGWVELVEPDAAIEDAGPSTARLFELMMRLPRARGLDSTGIVYRSLDAYLCRAGLRDIVRREFPSPVGEWGGQVGSLLATDLRSLFTILTDVFVDRLGVTAAECHGHLRAMARELEEHRSTITLAVAYGRREA